MKNLIFIFIFLLAFLSNRQVIAMATKPSQQFVGGEKVKSFPKKIKEKKTTHLFALPTRYAFNSMLMIFAELKRSFHTKKQDNTKSKFSQIISSIMRLVGFFSLLMLVAMIVLLLVWLVTLGAFKISIWLILGGIALFMVLTWFSVFIIEDVLKEQVLRC